MVDFSNHKVEIFPNINDLPRLPTAQRAGNGADFINKHNALVDDIQSNIDYLLSSTELSILSEDKTWYVNQLSGSNSNDGLTPETAFSQLEKATSVATSFINPFGNYQRKIVLAPGLYFSRLSPFIPSSPSDVIAIEGEPGLRHQISLGFTVVSGGSLYKFSELSINSRILGTAFLEQGLLVDCAMLWLDNVVFGYGTPNPSAAVNKHITCRNHSIIKITGGYEIQESVNVAHIHLDNSSFLDLNHHVYRYEFGESPVSTAPTTITLTPGLTLANFAVLERNSFLSAKNVTFVGTAIGQKFTADTNSVIDTDSGDIGLFPGDVAGVLTKGSQYF